MAFVRTTNVGTPQATGNHLSYVTSNVNYIIAFCFHCFIVGHKNEIGKKAKMHILVQTLAAPENNNKLLLLLHVLERAFGVNKIIKRRST